MLGLQPDELDVTRIEQQVHERMERVRRYQLTHPEIATDAMNRLAQALICLTDPAARKAYDATLAAARAARSAPQLSPVTAPPAEVPAQAPAIPVAPALPVAEAQTQLNWQTSPPPPRSRSEQETITALDNLAATDDNTPALPPEPARNGVPIAAAASPHVPPADAASEAARWSSSARRGLGTKRALYYRIAKTRQLLWAWDRVGKYLNEPKRELTRKAEGDDLSRQLRTVQELLRTFPPLLGEAGQPGCYVMALARQPMILPTLQTLVPSQRDRLAEDWTAGHKLLLAHRQFLRDELRSLRRKSGLARVLRTVRALLADNPGTILVVLAVMAVNLADRELIRLWWPEQLVILAGMAALRLYLWWDTMQQLRPVRIETAPAPIHRPRRRVRPQRQAQ